MGASGAFFNEEIMKTILGIKQGMSQDWIDGKRTPVTLIKAGPCVVTQILENSIQLGFGQKKLKNTPKPLQGHLKKVLTKTYAPRFLCEVEKDDGDELKIGDKIKLSDIFSVGDVVSTTSVSKGKGFAGVVKRWNFAGGPRTHGQSDRQRAPGSIGQGTDPGRVRKGKKMAGRMGSQRTTIKNLKVVSLDEKKNLLAISGPIAGPAGGLVIISRLKEGEKQNG